MKQSKCLLKIRRDYVSTFSLSLIGKSKSIESFKVSSLQSLWLLADDWAKSFLHYTGERCMVCAVLWKIWSMSVDTYPFYKLCMVRSGTSLIGTENLCGWAWLSIFSPRLLPFLSLILHLFIVHLPNYSTNPTNNYWSLSMCQTLRVQWRKLQGPGLQVAGRLISGVGRGWQVNSHFYYNVLNVVIKGSTPLQKDAGGVCQGVRLG